jgi:hypothetical protein
VALFHCAPKNATLSQLRLADVHLGCAAVLFILLGAISLLIFPRDMSPGGLPPSGGHADTGSCMIRRKRETADGDEGLLGRVQGRCRGPVRVHTRGDV